MVPRARIAVAVVSTAIVVGVVLVATGVVGVSEKAEGEKASLREFARERAGVHARKLPLAVIREKIEKGKEGGGEIASGPAQQQVDQRAYPRGYVETKRARAARQAYLAAPTRLAASAFGRGAVDGAQRDALAADWTELGPTIPTVPAEVTYTGAPTTNSGRVTALAIDPNCGAPGAGCRMWVAAAGGGIFRTPDALAASVSWTPSSAGMASNAIGSLISDPTDASGNTLYAGTGEPNGSSDSEAGVGLYKSTDGGVSWSLVPGSPAVAHDRSIATIAVDPGNANHVFIGTALARHGSSSSNGGRRTPPDAPTLGVYETTDGGTSFALAFSKPGDPTPPDTGADFFTGGVNKIELDPNDPRVVYAAVLGYGIWRRDAATTTFAQVFATLYPADSVEADAPGDTFGDRTEFDLADLGAKTRMYIGDSSDDNLYSALWRTDDAGQAAGNLVSAPTVTANAANRTPAYVSLSDPDIADTDGFTSYFFCHTQCGYDIFVVADPRNADTVYLGGSMNYDEIFGATDVTPGRTNGRAVVRSTNAGESFTDMTNENRPTILDDPSTPPDQRAQGMHPDQHALVFSPANGAGSERVFIGSDGGVVRTSGAFANDSARCDSRQEANPDDAKFTSAELALCHQALRAVPTGIESLNAGLSTLQFQSLSLSAASPAGDVLGGTQDNGTWAFTGDPAGWFESIGGDGGQSAIDPNAGTRVHTYFGPTTDVNFHGNDPNTWDYISQPLDEANALCGTVDPRGECFSFYVPMIADPSVPGTLFTGGEYVWRTQESGGDQEELDAHCRETAFLVGDGKAVCGDWVRLGGTKGHIGDPANYIVATERTPADANTLWVGRRRGGVFVSTNAGAARARRVRFTQVSQPSIPDRFVSSIYVDPADADHAWVSFSGYEAYTPTQPGHVFEVRFNRATGTATWTDLSGATGTPGAIGDQPVTDLVRDDATGDLYAATDFGVLRRPNGATQWEQAAGGLPPVAVYGLTVSSSGRLLYAATHGRGIWRVALPPAPVAVATTSPSASDATTPPPADMSPPTGGTPVPAMRKPLIGTLSVRRAHGTLMAVNISLKRARSVALVIRDQYGHTIGQRTVKIKRDALFTLLVTVRPRANAGARTQWHVAATATGPGNLRTHKEARSLA